MPLTIGVPRETAAGEKRVATVPEVVEKLIKLGFAVLVESGAGEAASISDDAYKAAGAAIAEGAANLWSSSDTNLWSSSDIIFKVRGPSAAEVSLMREGCTLVSFIWPAQNPELLQQLTARKATVLAIDSLPRTLSRAQKMDALTSQAGVAGYRAVIEAANAFGRFFNGQITAAGKVPPAKVFVAGAGVAGLAAIGRPGGDWHCRQPRRHRSRQRHASRSGRSGCIAGRRIRKSRLRGGGVRWRRLREGDERRLPESPARHVRQASPGGGHHYHHRADSWQAGAQADHRRDGPLNESGQRNRRYGRRTGRELRAD